MNEALYRALAGLNTQQREAVMHFESPLLILAGAGSGKTRVVTVKVAYIIEELRESPHSILAVTFTNKAANEMRERAAGLTPHASDATIRTFHSFGAWFLRRNADVIGIPRGFSIYDDDDSTTLVHSLYPQFNRNTCGLWARQISRAKDYCLTPDDDLSTISDDPQFSAIYAAYQRRLEEMGNVDFGDLIMLPVLSIDRDSGLAERTRSRFRYLLVDEYQDSNVAQYRLLRALTGEESFVCVVGDDDQSIYRFRGAEVRNILGFPDLFPGTRIVRLEQNYRSTAPILRIADAVVAHNSGRLGKTLFTTRDGGEQPTVAYLEDQDDEVDLVVQLLESETDRSADPLETAVLYRTNAQSRLFETAFLRLGIPYRIIGTVRFYEREEIRDAVALLKLLSNPRDEVAFRRVINKPARGLGAKSVDAIIAKAANSDGDLLAAGREASVTKRAREPLQAFVTAYRETARVLDEPSDEASGSGDDGTMRLGRVAETLLERSGIWTYHREQDSVAGTQKVQNMEELINAAALYDANRDGLVAFLEAIELDSARETATAEDARVVLITMHNTKGLEFDRVVITGLEEGLFPRGSDPDELEEERRLFYVAITRARDELYMTCCRMRRIHGRVTPMGASPFLEEIPQGSCRTIGAARFDSAKEELDEWPRGTVVYHDDYGSGCVVRSWVSGREPCVLVRFETGRTAQFLPRYAPLERIAGETW